MRIIVSLAFIFIIFSCTERIENRQIPASNDTLGFYFYQKAKKLHKKTRYDSAYYYYQQAEKIYFQQKDSFMLSKIFLSKAIIDYMYHDLPSSEAYCIKALEYLPEKHSKFKKSIYNILAVVSLEKKDFPVAIKYFKKYQKAYRKEKDTLFYFIAYHNNISNAFRDQELYKQALAHLDSVLSVPGLDTIYPKKFARALDNKAHILIKMNQLDKGKVLLDSAYHIRLKIHDNSGLIQSHLNYAGYYQKIHRKALSKYHSLKALELSVKNKIPENQLKSYENLVHIKLPDDDIYFDKYLALQDSIRFEQQKAKDQTARIRFESAEKEREIEAQQQIILQNKIRLRWFLLVLLIVSLASLVFALQLHKIRKQNKIIKQKNTTIENIYKDMHHRIKNNLRIIHQNYIEPAMERTTNPETVEILEKIRKNIISLRKLHMMLLDERPNIRVSLAKMVDKTIDYVGNALPGNRIQINKFVDKDIEVWYKQAFPVILIINEFITNSYKHAFEGVDKPQIDITITRKGNEIRILLKDNGIGMSDEINVEQLQSDGLKLISSLVTELKGKLKIRNNNGFEVEIIFPLQL